MYKAVFLDRDGVINFKKEGGYVTCWDEFIFKPAVKEAIKILNNLGYKVIVITNQSAIARGLLSQEELEKLHQLMVKEITEYGGKIDGIYYCPHHPDDNCECRKPKPKLILEAAKVYNIDLKKSWMLGDEDKDIEAGKFAGCKTKKINADYTLLDFVLNLKKDEA